MPTRDLPLFSPTFRNSDDIVLRDESALQYNGFIDDLGGINVRPGESNGVNSGSRIDGLYAWPENPLVAVFGGNVQLYNAVGKVLTAFGAASALSFAPGVPVVFANNELYTFMAGGGKINYIDPLGVVNVITDIDAPTVVTHVAFLDGYILAISGRKLYWSDIPANTAWSALSFASAEGNPDVILAMAVLQRQIYLFGTVSTEIWENDGESPFSRIPGGYLDAGIAAKYSVVTTDNDIIWLHHRKYFVRFAGKSVERISTPYDTEIENFTTVSDCVASRIDFAGRTICLFNFVSEARTLAFDTMSGEWSEWGGWNDQSMSWEPYDFTSATFDSATGSTFIGKDSSRRIVALDRSSRLDLLVDSATRKVKFLKQSGQIDHGTLQKKRNEVVRLRAKRGSPGSTTNPKLMVRYRDNGNSQWSNIKEISLGAVGDKELVIEFRRTGIYKTRQYELSATDDCGVTLAKAEEDFTILR